MKNVFDWIRAEVEKERGGVQGSYQAAHLKSRGNWAIYSIPYDTVGIYEA